MLAGLLMHGMKNVPISSFSKLQYLFIAIMRCYRKLWEHYQPTSRFCSFLNEMYMFFYVVIQIIL